MTDSSERQAALGRLKLILPGKEQTLQVPGSLHSAPRSPLGHISGPKCCTQTNSISAGQEEMKDARDEPGHLTLCFRETGERARFLHLACISLGSPGSVSISKLN